MTRPRAKKRLGQHFLRDPSIITKILDALEMESGDPVLEIGPGPGTLTLPLARRGFGCTAVERDPDMVAYLGTQNFDQPVQVIEADFLELDIEPLIKPGTKILSNLPYNVSVPITAKLLAYWQMIPLMVLMFQKEVADRIRALPDTKDYGTISVAVQLFYRIDMAFTVAPGAFVPPPKVTSTVLRLRALDQPALAVEDLDRLRILLQALFQHRRKMIPSTLRSLSKWSPNWSPGPALLESFIACGFDRQARPENLAPLDYALWLRRLKEDYG